MDQFTTTWHITKTGDDKYHVHGGDQYSQIEEDVDGPKLMGMLTAKARSVAEAMEIVFAMDDKEIGFQKTVVLRRQPLDAGTELRAPFEHEINPKGTKCSPDCPACRWLQERAQKLGA